MPSINDVRILPFELIESAARHPTVGGVETQLTVEQGLHQVAVSIGERTLDSRTDAIVEPLHRFPLPKSPVSTHTRIREWTLLKVSSSGTTTASVTVSWNQRDLTDYLAMGTWLHVDGAPRPGEMTDATVGAFVEAPEFNGPASIPQLGTATYRGHASGLYTFFSGPGWQQTYDPAFVPPDGTVETGLYTGVIDLTANFEANVISGCIGCPRPGEDPEMILLEVVSDSLLPDGTRGVFNSQYFNDPALNRANGLIPSYIVLGAASLTPDGAFSGDDVTLELGYFPTGSTPSGSWEGRFSTIADESGPPRLVGGTTNAQWNHPTAGRAIFTGSFLAGHE